MIKYKRWIRGGFLFPLVVLFVVAETALAQSSSNYQVKKSVADQGGAVSQSTSFQVIDVIGQPSPVGVTSNTNYQIASGFLAGSPISTDIAETVEDIAPLNFRLIQNYPNPFNPETTIEYHLPQAAQVLLIIYDLRGHEVRRLVYGMKSAGSHTVQWDGRNTAGLLAASGMYFYRIEVRATDVGQQSYVDVRKMILMK